MQAIQRLMTSRLVVFISNPLWDWFEDESNIFMRFESDLQDIRNNIELRAVVGCSYEYQRLVLSLRYHHGLSKTANGEFNYFNRLTQQNEFSHSADLFCRSLQLTLGYRLDL